MITKRHFCLALILLTFGGATGQGRTTFVGVETGFHAIIATYSDQGFIRGDNSPSIDLDPSSSQGIGSQLYRGFAAIRIERRTRNDKFGISTGILFSELSGYLKKNVYPNYYYLLYDQMGTTTEYLRVREIHQTSGYLGIPIELHYFPFVRRMAGTYFIAGGNLNYRLFTNNKTTFQLPAMGKYESGVSEVVGAPSPRFVSFYGGVGWRFGKEGKPRYGVELTVPIIMTNSVSTLMKPIVGIGVHVQVQLPIKKKKK